MLLLWPGRGRSIAKSTAVGAPRELAGAKLSILDVRCKDRAGTKFVVEMQLIHVAGFINGCKAYADQLKAGESYTKLTDVVAISICDFELWPDAEQDAQKLPLVPMLSRWYLTESISDHHRLPENPAGTNRLLQVQYAFLELPKLPSRKPDTGALQCAFLVAPVRLRHRVVVRRPDQDEPPG
jgi:PD-(D/E)XK nuclease family transposase